MHRILRLLASVMTFLLGIIATHDGSICHNQKLEVTASLNQTADVSVPLPTYESECSEPKGFPGLSETISDTKRHLSDKTARDNFSWKPELLSAIKEESFLDFDKEVQAYRFVWLRTFHHPVYVRVERRKDHITLFSKELNGMGGYSLGKPIRNVTKRLSEKQWCDVIDHLDKADFWNSPFHDTSLGGPDGSTWVLEAINKGRYHVVERWTPENSEFKNACIYLLKLSGIDVDKLRDDLY